MNKRNAAAAARFLRWNEEDFLDIMQVLRDDE